MKNRRKKKPKSVFHMGELVEITDPAQQAEVDRRFREAVRAVDGEYAVPRKTKRKSEK